jgi:ribonuclease HI
MWKKRAKAISPELIKYLKKVREMKKNFNGYTVQHIPRVENNEADMLAKDATQNLPLPPEVFFEIITSPSAKEKKRENGKYYRAIRLESAHHGISKRSLRTI